MQKKNILFLSSELKEGGSEEIILSLAKNLNHTKYNVFVASLFYGPIKKIFEANQINFFKVTGESVSDKLKSIKKSIIKYKIDYIFCNYLPIGHLLTPTRIKSIEIVHGIYDWLIGDPDYINALKKSSKIVCVSEPVQEFMIEHFENFENKMVVIENGIDPVKLEPTIDASEMKEQLNIPDDALIIGSISRICYEKGINRIIELAKILNKKYDNLCFVIAGDYKREEHFFDELQRDIEENNLSNIIFTGYIKNVSNILQTFDIFVFPSHALEGLQLALIEALKMGTAVVTTNVGIVNFDEDMSDEEIGYILDDYTDELFADRVAKLIDNEDLREEIGEKNKETFFDKYLVSDMVQKYERLLDNLD